MEAEKKKPMRNSKLPTPLAKITSSSFEDALPPLVEDKSPSTNPIYLINRRFMLGFNPGLSFNLELKFFIKMENGPI